MLVQTLHSRLCPQKSWKIVLALLPRYIASYPDEFVTKREVDISTEIGQPRMVFEKTVFRIVRKAVARDEGGGDKLTALAEGMKNLNM